MIITVLFHVFILTQPLFIGKLLLTVLFYTVCNAVCHCLLNERDDDDDAGWITSMDQRRLGWSQSRSFSTEHWHGASLYRGGFSRPFNVAHSLVTKTRTCRRGKQCDFTVAPEQC